MVSLGDRAVQASWERRETEETALDSRAPPVYLDPQVVQECSTVPKEQCFQSLQDHTARRALTVIIAPQMGMLTVFGVGLKEKRDREASQGFLPQ